MNTATQSVDRFSAHFQKVFSAGAGGLSGLLSGFGGKMVAGLGLTYAVGKIQGALTGLQDRVKEIRAGAGALGLTTDEFQRLSNVMEASGSGPEKLTHAFVELAKAQEEIKEGGAGSEKTLKMFAALGVSLSDLKTKEVGQLFFQIADAMKTASMDGEKLAAMAKVFGNRNLYAVVPAIRKGFDGTIANANVVDEASIETMKKQAEQRRTWTTPLAIFGNSLTEVVADKWSSFLTGWAHMLGVKGDPYASKRASQEKKVADAQIANAKAKADKEADLEQAEKLKLEARKNGSEISKKLTAFDDARNAEGYAAFQTAKSANQRQLTDTQRNGNSLGLGRVDVSSNPFRNPKQVVEENQLTELKKIWDEQTKLIVEIKKLTGS
jgi:hypothetical protein